MAIFTRRNALVGWAVTRYARRRLERRLNELAGNRKRRSLPAVWMALVGGVAVLTGALVARRVA